MRSMASGAAFHRAYLHATRQAFLEAHEHAFAYFGGVFHLLRYDNLASAVRKILRGYRREETVRFLAFRSHWRFAAEFCTPGEGHEKGGIEGEGGYFRRNHLVPGPHARCAEHHAADGLSCGRGADPGRTQRDGRGGDGDRAWASAVMSHRGRRAGGNRVRVGRQARLCDGEDQRLLSACPRGRPGGSAGPSAACRDLPCRSADRASPNAVTAAASMSSISSLTSTC